jgi:serine/threonine protein kinase
MAGDVPTTIGDFEIKSRIGVGGMGVVYKARQLSLDRFVALKVLGSRIADPRRQARFERESQTAARLNHPGIASIYFVGEHEDVAYLAMELVDGASLRQLIDQMAQAEAADTSIDSIARSPRAAAGHVSEIRFDEESPPEEESSDSGSTSSAARKLMASKDHVRRCCEIAIEAADALAHAHKHGVTHRDLKPDNLMLDREGHVRIIDFGLARFFEDEAITYAGDLVGTPMYMSPEQVTGRIELDHRTDIYSLGLVLYELLALEHPVPATSRETVLRHIVTKQLPPVSWRNKAIPPRLEAVVHKATARDPDERYQSANALGADLRSFLDGQTVSAQLYEYPFDDREIRAQRPAHVGVAAFVSFLFAVVILGYASFTAWCSAIPSSELYLADLTFGPTRQFVEKLKAAYLAGWSLMYGLVGFNLMWGMRWSRWAAAAMGPLVPVVVVWTWPTDGAKLDLTALRIALIPLGIIMTGSMLWRRGGDWFRFSAQARREYERQVVRPD